VLEGLDLDVPGGSIYALVGPNGAGKTTTIKILLNIIGPSSGRSEVLGADSRRLAPRDFTQIGLSPVQEIPTAPGVLMARKPVAWFTRTFEFRNIRISDYVR
jgi:ABC-type multidrug transport system ATPase subunit